MQPSASNHRDYRDLLRAARQESSALQADDVSRLVSTAAQTSPTLSSRILQRPMLPITLAVTTALAALAGTYIIHQSPKPAPQPVQPQTQQLRMATPTDAAPTSEVIEGDHGADTSVRVVIDVQRRTNGDGDFPAALESADLALPYLSSLATLDIVNADNIDVCLMKKDGKDQRHITIIVNGVKHEAIVPAGQAPMPMLMTDASGKGRCVVAADADPNTLIPVESGEGDHKVIMWFPPTDELMKALPESVEREMKEVMDVNVLIDNGVITVKTHQKDGNGVVRDTVETMDIPDIQQKIRVVMDSTNKLLRTLSANMRTLRVDVNAKDCLPDMKKMQMNIDSALSAANMRNTKQLNSIRVRTLVMSNNRCQSVKAGLQEVAKTSNGAITETQVFPNPATNSSATLTFTLLEDRAITVTLTDLSGQNVATLVQGQRLGVGDKSVPLTLSGVPAGMYMVELRTEKGERVVKRLIVQ